MIYLIALTVVLLSIFLYLLIELKKSIHLLYVIPITILFTSGSYFYLDSLFGYPVPKTNEKEFILISHYIGPEEDNIYLWVLLKDENIPKVVYFPYDRESHEALEEAKRKIEDGQAVVGEFQEEGEELTESEDQINNNQHTNNGSNKSKGGSFVLYDFDVDTFLPRK